MPDLPPSPQTVELGDKTLKAFAEIVREAVDASIDAHFGPASQVDLQGISAPAFFDLGLWPGPAELPGPPRAAATGQTATPRGNTRTGPVTFAQPAREPSR